MTRTCGGWRIALATPAALLYSLVFFVPLLALFRYSFATSNNLNLELVWTLQNYRTIFSASIYLPLLLHSLWIAALVTFFAVLVGFPVAYIIARAPERHRTLLIILLVIPWWSSFIVRIFAWYTIFGRSGVINRTLDLLQITSAPIEFF